MFDVARVYLVTDTHGNTVELSEQEANDLCDTVIQQNLQKKVKAKLEEVCERESLEINKISPQYIEAIVRFCDYHRVADQIDAINAGINKYIDKLRDIAGRSPKPKVTERE